MKVIFNFLVWLVPCFVGAQNLIVNGSFETLSLCPGSANGFGVDKAVPWQSATINTTPPHIYNVCAIDSVFGVPLNGNQSECYQNPLTGNGYAGFAVFSSNVANFRQYIRYPLNEALSAGTSYCLSFHINLLDYSSDAIDAIGAYFSDSALTCTSVYCLLNFAPQVSNPAGNILADTLNWMQISGCFVAQGTERFMHIGNFNSDSATQTVYNPNGTYVGYYYIDDVSLYADTSLSIKETVKENFFTVFPNPATNAFSINSKKNVQEVVVSDVRGKIVLQQPFSRSIDVSNLANGCYFLRCKFEDGESAYVKVSVLH